MTKINLYELISPFCNQPYQGLFLPNWGHVLLQWHLVAWSGRWGAVLSSPVDSSNESHGHSSHFWCHWLPNLLLEGHLDKGCFEDSMVWWSNLWSPEPELWQPAHEMCPAYVDLRIPDIPAWTWSCWTLTILLLRYGPACSRGAKLINSSLCYEGYMLLCMLWCSQWEPPLPAKPCNSGQADVVPALPGLQLPSILHNLRCSKVMSFGISSIQLSFCVL